MNVVGVDQIADKMSLNQPQCQFYVVRKKRLCRMTVRSGRNYCGEHEPLPKTEKGQDTTRIPCPYDPKHTCYANKLLKHLAICNARQSDLPNYIIHNINSQSSIQPVPRTLLSQISQQKILALIEKINILYDKYVKGTIITVSDKPIHNAVMADFIEEGRAESSLRHLRQVSSLLHILEVEGLVKDNTCYVELGAGKGHLSYYAYRAWCGDNMSKVVLVDRASLRHKRDNKLRDTARSCRIRADLAHLALGHVPQVAECDAVVGFAKHLCGAATDFALRCITNDSVVQRVRGAVVATCCHHRCEPTAYVGAQQLQEMGITEEDFNIMLGAVSWATCGHGRSRLQPAADDSAKNAESAGSEELRAERARAGRRAKALLDYGRVRYLEARGLQARLCHYVPADVSLENVAIVARKP